MHFERLKFGKPPPDPNDRAKGGFLTKATFRRMLKLKEAEAAIPWLPKPGETLHTVLIGCFDLAHLLSVLLGRFGSKCKHMVIATLSLSVKNVNEMCGWLDNGQVGKLDCLVSHFFQKHDKQIFTRLLQELGQRNQRISVARSHCKIVLIHLEDGRMYTICGSMNLRSNGNTEHMCITQCPELHGWYSEWLEGVINAHQVHPDGNAKAN